jgi:hypothetical protein
MRFIENINEIKRIVQLHWQECNGTYSIALLGNGIFYSISRDHKQPIKRSDFNKVLYNGIYSLSLFKWGHSTWRPVSKHDVLPASLFDWAFYYDALSSPRLYQCFKVNIVFSKLYYRLVAHPLNDRLP